MNLPVLTTTAKFFFSHLDISDNSVLSHINSSEMNHSIISFNWKKKMYLKSGKKVRDSVL